VDLLLSGDPVEEVKTLSTRFMDSEELVGIIAIADSAPVGRYEVQVTTSGGKRGIPIEDFQILDSPRAIRLEFTSGPGSALSGLTFWKPIEVRAKTADGWTDSRFEGTVSIALGGSSGATLIGTTSAKAIHGVATFFGDLRIDESGTGYTLTATAPGLKSATSAGFDVGLRGEFAGRIAFTGDRGNREIFVTESHGPEIVNVTNHPADDWSPALSRDRSRIVFISDRDDPAGDLYSVNADGSGLARLTESPGFDWVGSQAWSPDGSRIVYTSARDDPKGEIYVMNADGSGVTRMTHEEGWDRDPAWSPDGASIAFTGHGRTDDDRENEDVIFRMSAVDGSGIIKVFNYGFSPVWSPDGSRLAFTSEWDVIPRRDQLAVIGLDGNGLVILEWPTTHAFSPSWSPDGSWIAFAMRESVWIVPFDPTSGFGEMNEIIQGGDPSWR
jgi:TolB protein